jgi:hypothetical protein
VSVKSLKDHCVVAVISPVPCPHFHALTPHYCVAASPRF